MHSKIYQITDRELSPDEFITADTFECGNIGDFADYTDDIRDEEREDCLETLDSILEGIFYREGNKLTFVGLTAFIEEWIAEIKLQANELDSENIKPFPTLFHLENVIKNTHTWR